MEPEVGDLVEITSFSGSAPEDYIGQLRIITRRHHHAGWFMTTIVALGKMQPCASSMFSAFKSEEITVLVKHFDLLMKGHRNDS